MGIVYGTDKQQQYDVCFVRKWEYILKWHIIMGFEHSKNWIQPSIVGDIAMLAGDSTNINQPFILGYFTGMYT